MFYRTGLPLWTNTFWFLEKCTFGAVTKEGREFARFFPTFWGDERQGPKGLIALVFLYIVFKNSTDVEKKDQNECAIYKYNNLIIVSAQ